MRRSHRPSERGLRGRIGQVGERPHLKLLAKRGANRAVPEVLEYQLSGTEEALSFDVRLIPEQGGGWALMDLEWDGGSARRWYRTFCDGVLGEYSLAYLVAELEERASWFWKTSRTRRWEPFHPAGSGGAGSRGPQAVPATNAKRRSTNPPPHGVGLERVRFKIMNHSQAEYR